MSFPNAKASAPSIGSQRGCGAERASLVTESNRTNYGTTATAAGAGAAAAESKRSSGTNSGPNISSQQAQRGDDIESSGGYIPSRRPRPVVAASESNAIGSTGLEDSSEEYLGFGISSIRVGKFCNATFTIESNPLEPMELWVSCFGNHGNATKRPYRKLNPQWIRDVQLAGPKPSTSGTNPCTRSAMEDESLRRAVELTWRDIDDDDKQINPFRYFQSADIIVVAIDAGNADWMQLCKLWLKEAIDSNVGNLRGIIFLVGNTNAPRNQQEELEKLLKKLEKTRYQLQFQGTVFVRKVDNDSGNSNQDYLFDKGSSVDAIKAGVVYILECHAELLRGGHWENFFNEWFVLDLWKSCCPKFEQQNSEKNKSAKTKPVKHKILRASEFYCLGKSHDESNEVLAEEYGKISTSVWDIAHLERLTFQSRILVESFFHTITPVYILAFGWAAIKRGYRKYAHVCDRRNEESPSRPNPLTGYQRDRSAVIYDGCKMCLFTAKKMRHVRSFWGSGKWLYARSPPMAMVKRTSSGYPIGYNWSLERGQIFCVTLLFLFHGLCVVLFGSTINMGFLQHISDDDTRHEFEITAHQYFVHYIGWCILYSVWTFVVIVPSQTSGVRQVTLLGTPRESDRITSLIQRLKNLALTRDDTPDTPNMRSIMNSLDLDDARTTENLEIIIKKRAYSSVSTRWKSLCLIAAVIACGLRIFVSYVTTVIHHSEFKDVTLCDRIQFHSLRAGSGLLVGLGIYMILYTAGATAKMCLMTMKLVTELLVFDEPEFRNTSCCESMRFCGCTKSDSLTALMSCGECVKKTHHEKEHRETLPRYLVPFLPLNAYGWLHMRQNLFNQTHASFVESSVILLVPVVLIAFSAGHVIVILFRKEDIFLRIGVLFDTVLFSIALLYVAYEASRLQDVQNRQLRLLSNHLTSVQQLRDQLERDREKETKYMEKILPLLSQSCTALEIVRATVRDNYLSMTVWPGITLSKDLVTTLVFTLGTLASTVYNYWQAQ